MCASAAGSCGFLGQLSLRPPQRMIHLAQHLLCFRLANSSFLDFFQPVRRAHIEFSAENSLTDILYFGLVFPHSVSFFCSYVFSLLPDELVIRLFLHIFLFFYFFRGFWSKKSTRDVRAYLAVKTAPKDSSRTSGGKALF